MRIVKSPSLWLEMSASIQKATASSLLCLRETESDSGSAPWYKPFISVYEVEAPK